jgi:hypothetical protein
MADDEPFDSLGGPVRKASTPNAPPSFAFDHGGNMSTPGIGPPPSAFGNPAPARATMGFEEEEDELGAMPSRTPAAPPTVMSTQMNDRWQQYETQMDGHRNDSSLENNTPQENPSDYRVSAKARTELNPHQPYSFRKSDSHDTDDLIRKYGGMSGVSPVISNYSRPPTSSSSSNSMQPADVRDQAQNMLNLVDDHLKTPIDIRRTESGGFRAAPPVPSNDEEDPYSFRRSPSTSSTGKRVPAALSGLNFNKSKPANNWKESGRYSFSDPSFRDDDHISDDEDVIIQSDGPFQDEPVVDVVGMESRAAGSRPYSDEKKFEGDFDGGSKSWSSRYTDSTAYVSQKHVLDKWDREFERDQERKSARNMFMSTASNIRSSASNVLSSAGSQKQKIFGSGGFSFRANHVFGHHKSASERPEINLRTVWREVDEDSPTSVPPVHKTWQEVMLNKRKRRRILGILFLLILGGIAASSAVTAIKNRQDSASMFSGSNIGQSVTFYVTSDSPYDDAAETRMVKDLANIPMESEFVVHLGNIQDAAVSMCAKNRYSDVASMLVKSPVPVFVLPGAEDWTKCPKPSKALDHWMEAFFDFDLKFKHSIPVKRDDANPEAFAFLHHGVLFVGMHVVSGPVMDDDEWVDRQKEMLKWYYGIANSNKGNFRNIVLLGNARPSAQQALFFDALFSNLKEHHAPIVYVHANQHGDDVMQYTPFEGHREIPAIGVQHGSSHPPLKITVGFGERPFMVG